MTNVSTSGSAFVLFLSVEDLPELICALIIIAASYRNTWHFLGSSGSTFYFPFEGWSQQTLRLITDGGELSKKVPFSKLNKWTILGTEDPICSDMPLFKSALITAEVENPCYGSEALSRQLYWFAIQTLNQQGSTNQAYVGHSN